MKTNSTNWIKVYIVDVLPCISVGLFVLAFFYHLTYYSVFGIDITKYASFGDIFIGIAGPLTALAVFAALCMGVLSEYFGEAQSYVERNNRLRAWTYSYITKPLRTHLRSLFKSNKLGQCLRNTVAYFKRKWKPVPKKTRKDVQVKPEVKTHPLMWIIAYSLMFFYIGGVYAMVLHHATFMPSLWTTLFPLLIPLFFSLLVNTVLLYLCPKFGKRRIDNYKNSNTKILTAIACYYVFALLVFADTGLERGLHVLNDRSVKFEIQTTDGQTYNDDRYVYIGHLSEYTFIYDRQTGDGMEMNNDGIVYTKMQETDKSRPSYLNLVLNYKNWLFNCMEFLGIKVLPQSPSSPNATIYNLFLRK